MARRQEQEQNQMAEVAARGPTPAEKSFQLVREKRVKQRTQEAIQYNHRQKMDRFNAHLGSLSEHFDIPKVGP